MPDAIVHPRTVSKRYYIRGRHANETGQEGHVIRQNARASSDDSINRMRIRKRRPDHSLTSGDRTPARTSRKPGSGDFEVA